LIQSEKNLSQKNACWVFGEGRVYGNAKIYGDAIVANSAIYGNA